MITFVPVSLEGEDRPGGVEEPSGEVTQLLHVLEAEHPEPESRIMALLKWYGSGMGPWSGFPSYEIVAERLLLEFPTEQLVIALTRHPLTPAHLEGAARYLCGYQFNMYRPGEAQQIPQELKERLLTHSLTSTDEDRIRRAEAALAG